MESNFPDTDTLLQVLVQLTRVDLDITLTKLYTYVRPFREFLSKQDTINYLQSRLGISNVTSFPMLCVHLSIRNPETSRVPERVCMLLAIRHNYPMIRQPQSQIDKMTMYACCDRIVHIIRNNLNIGEARTAMRILGKERSGAIFEGGISGTYKYGMICCLFITGLCEYAMEYVKDKSSSPNYAELKGELIEGMVHVISTNVEWIDIISHCAINSLNLRSAILLSLMRRDLLDVIKALIDKGTFTLDDVVSRFDTLSSTNVFDWLHSEHHYGLENITTQHYPYEGTCLHALKILYGSNRETITTNIVEAAIESDDVESLVWLRDTGRLDNTVFIACSSGITEEIIASYRQ